MLVIKEKSSYCQSICSICYLEISRDSQVFRSYRLGIELNVCVCVLNLVKPGNICHLLEEGMATHSSILAWRIPWTEEAGRLQSMGSQRVGQD